MFRTHLTMTSLIGLTITSLFASTALAGAGSESQTAYQGARILNYGTEVMGGYEQVGIYGDEDDDVNRYASWQGDTLVFGATSAEGNTVDGIAEFFWFESSVPKSADLYLVLLKVRSSPLIGEGWQLSQEDGFWDGWGNNPASQSVFAEMAGNGANGAINFSYSLPFQNYGYDVKQVNQISQGYSAGVDLTATGSIGGGLGANAGAKFDIPLTEGVFLKTAVDSNTSIDGKIQSKGYFQKQYSVTSNYTVTVYNWQMAVTGGAVNDNDNKMMWDLFVAEENDKEDDSAYHEYFLAVQVPQGKTGHIQQLSIAGAFENDWWIGIGESKDQVDVIVADITFDPPAEIECYWNDPTPTAEETGCPTVGVCGNVEVVCNEGQWACVLPQSYESGSEYSCDGLDNDCDGSVDEDVFQYCWDSCGEGVSVCANGLWSECSTSPDVEKCDGFDNNCDGLIDENLSKSCVTEHSGVGSQECVFGSWTTCLLEADKVETCNGLDDNFNGQVDESLAVDCETSCGMGTQTCMSGSWSTCTAPTPSAEICDGKDNDCDDVVDDNLEQPCQNAVGQPGKEICISGTWMFCDAPDVIMPGSDNDTAAPIVVTAPGSGCAGSGSSPISNFLLILAGLSGLVIRRRSAAV